MQWSFSHIGSEDAQDKNSSPSTTSEDGAIEQPLAAAKSDAPDGLLHDIVNVGANLYNAASSLYGGGGLGLSECLGRAGEGLQSAGSWAARPLLGSLVDIEPKRGDSYKRGRSSDGSSTAAEAHSSNARVPSAKRPKAEAGKGQRTKTFN